MTALSAASPSAFSAFGHARNELVQTPARTPASVRGAGSPPDGGSEQSLMARVAAGDRNAIALIFTRHQLRVYRFVLRLVGNTATAEDLVSEVFLEVWRRASSFEGRARLSTFILAVARNKAMTALRGRIDQPLDEAALEEMPDSAASAEEIVEQGQRAALLQQCLQQLPPAQRAIIDLVYYHEQSVDEVAAIVGIPPATVKTRMFYARRRLGELLRIAGVDAAVVR
jgi:RNA polymerase sigma-70 factor (ECF subfamily)